MCPVSCNCMQILGMRGARRKVHVVEGRRGTCVTLGFSISLAPELLRHPLEVGYLSRVSIHTDLWTRACFSRHSSLAGCKSWQLLKRGV